MIYDRLTDEHKAKLREDQHSLEVEAIDEGIAAYRRRRGNQEAAEGNPEKSLIIYAIEGLTSAIEKAVSDYLEGQPMKGAQQWGPCLLSMEPDKIALITLRQIISAKPGQQNAIHHSLSIAKGVKMERELMVLKDNHRDVYNIIKKRNKKWNWRAHKAAKAKADIVDIEWDKRRSLHLGQILLHLAVEHTALFQVDRWYEKGKKTFRVRLCDEALAWIEQEHGKCEILEPRFLPMVVPPLNWTDQNDGGYFVLREPLIKPSVGVGRPAERDHNPMPKVFDAINIIQQTEWCINKKVYEVQRDMWLGGGDKAGLPPKDLIDIPPVPDDIDTNEQAKKEWKAKATEIYDLNAELSSKRLAVEAQLTVAKKLLDYPAIYFPHQLDWRGRVYPLASYLNPQSQDSGRGLLQFAEPKRLGPDGWYWLRVHAANCYGVDKVSFNDRVMWVMDNLRDIERSVLDPHHHRWWAKADKPWAFLAACFEISAAMKKQYPADYESSIPVAMDGSCNGLQHLSAMGLDQIGGNAVNLMPGALPADIYQTVADEVNRLIERDIECNDQTEPTIRSGTSPCSNGDGMPSPESTCETDTSAILRSIAIGWKGRITRKVVKRAVMTVPYGLTSQGMLKQLLEDKWANTHLEAAYLRDRIEEAMDGTIVKARDIMSWLQEVANITAAQGHALRWVTPTGFLVIQEYLEQKVKTIFTMLQKLTYRVTDEDSEVSVHRQVRGLPPNFVHSFDAAHLMLTVLAAHAVGMKSFALIHDSYGVHAADVSEFHRLIRQTFIDIYSTDWMKRQHRGWELETGCVLPEPPSLGELDLTQVMASSYFFS